MSSPRFHYLDNLRVFAMLFGILVHTCTISDFGGLEVITQVSDNFRMGTFFAISGYFAALLLARQSRGSFLKSRITALGVPCLAALVLLNPVTLWLIFRIHEAPVPIWHLPQVVRLSIFRDAPVSGPIIWHLHLWFLLSLCFYSATAPALLPLLHRMGDWMGSARLVPRLPPIIYPLLVATGVAFLVVGMRAIFKFTLRPLDPPWVVLATVQYWPFYILGLWLHGQARLWHTLHRIDPLLIGASVILWAAVGQFAVRDGILFETTEAIRHSLTVCAALFSLLWLFQKVFNKQTSFSTLLSGSIYTIYLFHFLVIYLLANLFAPVPKDGSALLFVLICGLTFAVTLSIHVLLVRRSAVLLFLFNGRLASSPRVRTAR